MANIGLVGYGIVGKAVGDAFQHINPIHKILAYDKFKKLDTLEDVVSQSDVVFVCVPTPHNSTTQRFDSSFIDDAMSNINSFYDKSNKPLIAIKSTLIPGTTMRYIEQYPEMKICYNPEFLTEKSPKEDFIYADRQLIGTIDIKNVRHLIDIYNGDFVVPVKSGHPTQIEVVKLMTNAYLATKVTFANEIYDLCKALGIDYSVVKNLFTQDKRMIDDHLDVTPERGFGGKCLPKDTMSLTGIMADFKVDSTLLDAVLDKNNKIRKIRDWEKIPFAITDLEE